MVQSGVCVPGLELPRNPFWFCSGVDMRLLELLTWLARCSGRRYGRPLAASWASQAWLSARVGCTREHVSRRLRRLADRGLVTIERRRREGGRWRTNLYRVVKRSVWRLAMMRRVFEGAAHHVISRSHNPTFGEQISKGILPTVSHSVTPSLAARGPMSEADIERRRAELRRQAQELISRGL